MYKYVRSPLEVKQSVIMDPPSVYPTLYEKYFLSPISYILLLMLVLLYLVVYFAYRRSTHRLGPLICSKKEMQARKITKMTVRIVVLFVICWVPMITLAPMTPPDPIQHPVRLAAFIMAFKLAFPILLIPNFANNFLYAWHQQDYKKAYLNLLPCRSRPNSISGITTVTSGSC